MIFFQLTMKICSESNGNLFRHAPSSMLRFVILQMNCIRSLRTIFKSKQRIQTKSGFQTRCDFAQSIKVSDCAMYIMDKNQ